MDTIRGAKILKIILCVGVFIWLVHFNVTQSVGWSVAAFSSALLLTALLYILATLFGFILAVTRNYVIAIILFLGIVIFGIFKMSELPPMSPVLEWGSLLAACGCALYLLHKDIRCLIGSMDSIPKGDDRQEKSDIE